LHASRGDRVNQRFPHFLLIQTQYISLQVIASPKGAAISFFLGLLRRSTPRNDSLFNAFVLISYYQHSHPRKPRSIFQPLPSETRGLGERISESWSRRYALLGLFVLPFAPLFDILPSEISSPITLLGEKVW